MSFKRIDFVVERADSESRARAGVLRTRHGTVKTPVFMPVATHAAMRGQDTESMRKLGTQVLLANTFHLLLRPGPEVFKKIGGIHKFMDWDRSVLTDSGGFQIFSLARFLKISDEGATFRSYVDGQSVHLTPEISISMQRAIDSDIMMVLDQCIASTAPREEVVEALARTTKWAKRSLEARGDSDQALFGIVQGACFPDLRRESISQITDISFDGFAIGGLAVGEDRAQREDITEMSAQLLPKDKPRYLMGVGTPIDLLEAVKRGVDMFDCILPTSLGQQGVCYTSRGKIDLRRGVYKMADVPLDVACECRTCKAYSRAYLHHLIKADEYLGGHLVGYHNLHFYRTLMDSIRESIVEGRFSEFYAKKRDSLVVFDEENPSNPPMRKLRSPPITLGDYEVVEHKDGYGSIRQVSSGEVMHSVEEPMREAKRLYVEQSRLEKLCIEETETPLVVWDVGLGAGTNAMAVVEMYEKLLADKKSVRPLQLISFEVDLDSINLALLHPRLFTHIRHQAPHAILRERTWRSKEGSLTWSLVNEDFLSSFKHAETPRIIFFDPFSYKTDLPLWSGACFEALADKCRNASTELFTYSASTLVRSLLLSCGFYVAKGAGTGPKTDTTVALTKAALELRDDITLLDSKWLERWERSDSKSPRDLDEVSRRIFEEKIRTHEQFNLVGTQRAHLA